MARLMNSYHVVPVFAKGCIRYAVSVDAVADVVWT